MLPLERRPLVTEVRLPRNVQFMYEHALARIEFEIGFAAKECTSDPFDPWAFQLDDDGSVKQLHERSAYAGFVDGKPTVYEQLIRPSYQGGEFNQTRSPNQFLTHWIYPYKGKFHPQMVRAILNIIHARPGDLVLDPFVGSGTTSLECQLLGIDSIGMDVSPLCVMLTRVKTHSYAHLAAIRKAVEDIRSSGVEHPDQLRSSDFRPRAVADFIEVAKMVTYSDMANRKRDPATYLHRNLHRMLVSAEAMAQAKRRFNLKFGKVRARRGDARDLSSAGLGDASVDAIVTSPPYSIALDYVKNDAHALRAMGYDLERLRQQFIGVRGKTKHEKLMAYNEDMKSSFAEMARVLKPGGRAVVVIGNATLDGTETTTTEEMVHWAAQYGLRLERKMPKIVWGLYNVVADEKILFFVRD